MISEIVASKIARRKRVMDDFRENWNLQLVPGFQLKQLGILVDSEVSGGEYALADVGISAKELRALLAVDPKQQYGKSNFKQLCEA